MADDPAAPTSQWLVDRSAEAATEVDDQIEKLKRTGVAVEHETPALGADRAVMREVAILSSLVARQTTADNAVAVRAVLDRLDALAGSIDRFTTVTDASSTKLARWTRVMAIATGVLAVATLLLVAATLGLVYVGLKVQPQIITVGKP